MKQLKEAREQEAKYTKLSKHKDHLIRALVHESRELMLEHYEKREAEELGQLLQWAELQAEKHREAWEKDKLEKERLSRMQADGKRIAKEVRWLDSEVAGWLAGCVARLLDG